MSIDPAIADSRFECDGLERFRTAEAAHGCKKCRVYVHDEDRTYTVTDTHTGKSIPLVIDEEQANYAAWKAENPIVFTAAEKALFAPEQTVGLDG